jgi:hypothetical protein
MAPPAGNGYAPTAWEAMDDAASDERSVDLADRLRYFADELKVYNAP